jgi:hypothetical protein
MVEFQEISIRVARRDIAFVNYIVEGYEGLATVSTRNADDGLLMLAYPRNQEAALFDLLGDLSEQGIIQEVIRS